MASLTVQTAASSDDAHENGAASQAMTLNGINIACNNHTGTWSGMRFLNITVPAGSTVNSAYVELNVVGTKSDDINVDIYAEDVDDATTFTSTAGDISGRTRTTAKTTWNELDTGASWQASPDITAVIQEVIDRAGWASGNDINIIFDALATISTDAMAFYAYDQTGNVSGPKLTIDYTAPTSTTIHSVGMMTV